MATRTFRVNGKQFAQYMATLGSRFHAAAVKGMRRAALRTQQHVQKRTGQVPPANPQQVGTGGAVNTGMYKRAWKYSPTPDGAVVFNAMPYAGVIEYGRRGNSAMPPLKAIEDWARRRLGLSQKEAKRAAFPIAKAIAKRGLQGRYVLTGAELDIQRFVQEEVQAELNAALTQLVGGGKP